MWSQALRYREVSHLVGGAFQSVSIKEQVELGQLNHLGQCEPPSAGSGPRVNCLQTLIYTAFVFMTAER